MQVTAEQARETISRWRVYHEAKLALERDRQKCFGLLCERENIDRRIEKSRCRFLWWEFADTEEEVRKSLPHYETASFASAHYKGYSRELQKSFDARSLELAILSHEGRGYVEVPAESEWLFDGSEPWNNTPNNPAHSVQIERKRHESNGSLWGVSR